MECTSTDDHQPKCLERPAHRTLLHVWAEHELMGHELYETGVDENTSTDRVERAVDEKRSAGTRGETLTDTETNGNGDRCGDAVAKSE